MALEEQTLEEYSSPFKLSWGAVFGGTFVALGVWILLSSLGAAVGLTAINPAHPSSARGAGIGTGIWTIIAPIIALFVGAMVGGRMAGVVDRLGGALHGAVIWGLTTVLGFIMVASLVSSIFGAALGLGGKAISAGGSAIGSAASAGGQAAPDVMSALGISSDDLLGPVNERLRSQGKPEVTAAQLQGVVRDVAPTAIRQGSIDREMVISAVVRNTQLSRQDAAGLADQLQSKLTAGKQQLGAGASQVGSQIQTGALKAAEATGKAFWVVFLALLLGLISSLLGALVGVSRDQRAFAARHVIGVGAPREAGT